MHFSQKTILSLLSSKEFACEKILKVG